MTFGYFSNAACRYYCVQWQQRKIPYMLLVVSCLVNIRAALYGDFLVLPMATLYS